ncbi:MAG: permease [Nitrospirae bacterium]|nr:permease [Nitrospirota bacterium]
MNNFIIILISILLEALPFILMGALLSGLIEVFVTDSVTARMTSFRTVTSVFIGSLMGVCLPMCECGSVLVVRRLIKKRVPPAAAIAYMLSAPIINPVTLLSTYTAYGWFKKMVLLRAGLGAVVAVLIGLLIHKFFREGVLKKRGGYELNIVRDQKLPFRVKLSQALTHAADDFISIFSMLLIGATAAALFKAFSPPAVFVFFQRGGWLGIPLFSALAVLLSVCSESDAFIASALHNVFDIPAQLAFLTLGPMLDLKLLVMYKKVFTGKVFLILCLAPPVVIMSSCFLLRWALR